MGVEKLIVTNIGALRSKYRAAGVKSIEAALKKLIAADLARGLTTEWVALDDKATMKRFGVTAVTEATDPKQNKTAIDGVYAGLMPDYLMILGASDVVPHQDLKNLLYSPPKGDTDAHAYGDLPYACDKPYSQRIRDFTGPTRVVSRLPDLRGATARVEYLLGLLRVAATWKSRPHRDYENYLGISAQIWKASTAETLRKLFNSDTDLQTSPAHGPKWREALINRRTHFINCHGGDTYPDFVGQASRNEHDLPVSHRAAFVAASKRIQEGTVCAAECCFGGQLYDRAFVAKQQMGMCNTYLAKKAYGFFGSTTIAYGPPSGNGQADLICRYFLERVLAGASLGRAALEARHRFIEKALPMSPSNQKTLAQFNLYGDPSIVPVATPPETRVTVGHKMVFLASHPRTARAVAGRATASNTSTAKSDTAARAQRRDNLKAKGKTLEALHPDMTESASTPPGVTTALHSLAAQMNLEHAATFSLDVASKPKAAGVRSTAKISLKGARSKQAPATAFHVMVATPNRRSKRTKAQASGETPHPVRKIVILEAKQVGDNVVISEGHSK